MRSIAAALSALLLSACATLPDISQSRSPCQLEPGGWCGFVREAARDAFPFALASTNAYTGDDDLFEKPGRVIQRVAHIPIAEADADKGFSYEIFNLYSPESGRDAARKPIARILAFRGTDMKSIADIFYGTLRNDQIELALRYFGGCLYDGPRTQCRPDPHGFLCPVVCPHGRLAMDAEPDLVR